jgi:hypothetical protein
MEGPCSTSAQCYPNCNLFEIQNSLSTRLCPNGSPEVLWRSIVAFWKLDSCGIPRAISPSANALIILDVPHI